MSEFPDQISAEALRAIEAMAPPEADLGDPKGNGPYDGLTKGQLIDQAEGFCTNALSKCGDPMIHKIMMLHMLTHLIEWHNTSGEEVNDVECRQAWHRDAGKLQAAYTLICDVGLGDNDFTYVK